MNVPECWEPSVNATPTSVCKAMQEALAYGAYLPWIRDNIIQAQYFKVRLRWVAVSKESTKKHFAMDMSPAM
jgi:hypothetical protein